MASTEVEQTVPIEKKRRVLTGKVALAAPTGVSIDLCKSLLGYPKNFDENLEVHYFPYNFVEQSNFNYTDYSVLFVHAVDITSQETLQKDIDTIQEFINAGIPVVILMTDLSIIASNSLLIKFVLWVNLHEKIRVYPRYIDTVNDSDLRNTANKTLIFCENICKIN